MKIDAAKFKKCTPPGIDFVNELKLCLTGLCAAVGYSVSFIAKYMTARANLYEWSLTGDVLREGAKIAGFDELIHSGLDSMDGFLVLIIAMLGLMGYHYFYYYQGSKSIYLMRRLPDKWELYKRCIALPLLTIAVTAAAAVGVLLLYYGIYLLFTPQQCLPL